MKNLLNKKSLKINIFLVFIHLIIIILAFITEPIKSNTLYFLISILWLPMYFIFIHQSIFDEYYYLVEHKDSLANHTTERAFVGIFALPIIGPIIAILRINYLQNEIEKRVKK